MGLSPTGSSPATTETSSHPPSSLKRSFSFLEPDYAAYGMTVGKVFLSKTTNTQTCMIFCQSFPSLVLGARLCHFSVSMVVLWTTTWKSLVTSIVPDCPVVLWQGVDMTDITISHAELWLTDVTLSRMAPGTQTSTAGTLSSPFPTSCKPLRVSFACWMLE